MAKVSIKDVAKQAGVSTATVSHVINKTRFVREETRLKVLDAINSLNYQPNAIARGLATNSTQAIGLVVSDITNPFFTTVVRIVENEFIQLGYHTIFCNTDEDPVREDEYLRLLAARQIDGLIIAPTGIHSTRLMQMSASEIPIVLLDRGSPDINAPLVEVDNESGGYQATKYLLELGHRRISVLRGLETIGTQVARTNGYLRALQEAGVPIDKDLIISANPLHYSNQHSSISNQPESPPTTLTNLQMTPNAFAALHQLLDLPDRPTAIFVCNNQMTLGVLYALKERNLTCPDDLSVICFDDHDWAPLFSPAITVVRQPTNRLGKLTADMLMKMINKEMVEYPTTLPVELIIRKSCRAIQV